MFFQTLFLFLRTVFFPRILIFPRNLYLLRSSSVSLTSSTDMFSSGKYGSIPKKRVMVSFLVQLLYIILRIAHSLNRVAIRIADTRRNYKIKNQIIIKSFDTCDKRSYNIKLKKEESKHMFKLLGRERLFSSFLFLFPSLYVYNTYIYIVHCILYTYVQKNKKKKKEREERRDRVNSAAIEKYSKEETTSRKHRTFPRNRRAGRVEAYGKERPIGENIRSVENRAR